MRYRTLGDSGLMVSELGVGCNAFGARTDAEEVTAIVDAALAAGITLFDTADTYSLGDSERLLGAALRGRREQAVVATKFGMDMDGRNGPDFGVRGSRRYLRIAVEASLRRLDTDYIDLYQLHAPDRITPIEETLGAMSELVTEGKVRYLGCSNVTAWERVNAHWVAAGIGAAPLVSAQNEYSLYNRSAEAELAPACEAVGVSILPYFPLAYGLLTGKYTRGQAAPEGSRLAVQESRLRDADFDKVEALQRFADDCGVPLLHVAIGGLLAQPAVGSVISGVSRPSQIESNVAAAQWQPSAEELAALDEVATPGVGTGYTTFAP
jgi:aryl-alcohol dehydrogenase-like predicted oxidoreductase